MQINDISNLGAANIQNTHESTVSKAFEQASRETVKKASEPLRSISLQNPTYNKNEVKEGAYDDLLDKQESGLSAKELKEQMVLNSENMTKEEQDELHKRGYSPMDMDKDDYVTIADKIRVQLAKGGMDISITGGLSDGKLETLGENTALSSEDLSRSIDNAMKKVGEMSPLTEDGMLYLIKNELPPTIDNVFAAEFSQGAHTVSSEYTNKIDLTKPEMQGVYAQIQGVIERAGLLEDEQTIDNARLLMENEIPVTEENLQYFDTLQKSELQTTPEGAAEAVLTAIEEGQSPGNAYLMEGFSLKSQAQDAYDVMQAVMPEDVTAILGKEEPLTIENLSAQMDGDASYGREQDAPTAFEQRFEMNLTAYSRTEISAMRMVQETRLMMTMEANYALYKQGVSVDTTPLEELVEALKEQEMAASSDTKVTEVLTKTEELKQMPVQLLGGFSQIDITTMNELHQAGSSMAAKLAQANERYETMQTEVRRDLGDSIQKAFQNVDDILADLELEPTEANQRAVRILGYNSLEITAANVSEMRYADELVQKAFKAMTPNAVTALIKAGENPLDMGLKQLCDTANQFSWEQESGSPEEKFSEFLWKLEQQKGITEEQRESFIGVYRLIHQVEASDGAVIGQLIHQGANLTLRNMMGAVRTRHHEGRDYTVDDHFGGVNSITASLSITQQIEAAFYTDRMADAGDAISPDKMMQFDSEDSYMNMNPDQFAQALEGMEEDPDIEEAYAREQMDRLAQAVASEERVYQMLSQMDMPTTPANLLAWSQYLADRNAGIRQMARNMNGRQAFSRIGSDIDFENNSVEDLISDTMQDIIEAFGEASKTPEEMAEAQEKLAKTAENVMRNMLIERDVQTVDVRGMKIAVKQLQMLGEKARETEQYAVPILVADEYGNMSLKIVRGKDEDKGQVDISFDMESTGAVSAKFRLEGNSLDGTITSSVEATRQLLSSRMGEMAAMFQEAAGMEVSLSFAKDETVDANAIYEETNYDFETTAERTAIQTTRLYAVARSFIRFMGELG